MAKKDLLADAIARVAELRTLEDRQKLAAGLAAALSERSCYVVARVATLAADRGVRAVIPALVQRLAALLNDPKSDDLGCEASLAMVKALITLEAGIEAEDIAGRAVRHTRWEPVRGGSVDVAVSVRGNAAILLAAMGSPRATSAAIELLAETDEIPPRERASWPARADAARALTMIGSDGAASVLLFKVLIDDPEPTVLSECLSGLLALKRDAALPLIDRLLIDDQQSRAEAALLALGTWRDPRAFSLLHTHANRFLDSGSRAMFVQSVAATRQPEAIDYLIDLIRTMPTLKADVVNALEPLRRLPGVSERIDAALASL